MICPRCKGNGFFYVKKEVKWPQKQEDIVVQCPQCESEGEINMLDEARLKSIEAEQRKLTVEHIKKLEQEIQRLMKQKAELQDQVDKQTDKEIKKS
jgi:predicted nuclease with TOPRIM domain